ncbi:MAG: TIGR04282 family arsenosugar biosynthesis glycosyltransferase [Eggerthellaceae bacterium]|nr:TIGR04282 family arsenosugar biosynthesis glycosyltransferase [Eggerthellaceae bacterium]
MSNERPCTIILFTRIPIAGRTKTRLLPILSADECALLQRAMALDLAEKLAALGSPLMLCYSDEWRDIEGGEALRDAFIEDVRQAASEAVELTIVSQEGSGLGQRMSNAMQMAFDAGAGGCILMGSDLPDVMRTDIEIAQRALTYSDVVLGPSSDGGYWLIGTRTPFPAIFEGKHYGGSSVLTEAVAACRAYGRKVALSRETFDIDVPQDYYQLCKQVSTGDFRLGPRTVEAVSHLMEVSAVVPEDSVQ